MAKLKFYVSMYSVQTVDMLVLDLMQGKFSPRYDYCTLTIIMGGIEISKMDPGNCGKTSLTWRIREKLSTIYV